MPDRKSLLFGILYKGGHDRRSKEKLSRKP